MQNFCKCGCGAEIPFIAKNGYPQYYLKGHNKIGPQNNCWKGGIKVDLDGYILVKNYDHHFRNNKNYILQHRLVWEQNNNAILLPWADVHHKNGNRYDNSPENLDAMMHGQHARHHRLEEIAQGIHNPTKYK